MVGPHLAQIQENLLSRSRPVEDADLLAFLLRGALPPGSLEATAEAFLHSLGGLRGLAAFSYQRAQALKLDDRSASLLLAVAELARRRPRWETRITTDLDDVPLNRYLRGLFAPGEVLGAIFLGPSRRFLGSMEVLRGRVHPEAFDPKPMLREALALGAGAILLAHVQPSRDAAWRDRATQAVCRQAFEACQALGIELVDYRILGTFFVSLRTVLL